MAEPQIGSPNDGVLRVQYEVHCRRCGEAVLGLGARLVEAAVELKQSYKWRQIDGKWFCGECALIVQRARAPHAAESGK